MLTDWCLRELGCGPNPDPVQISCPFCYRFYRLGASIYVIIAHVTVEKKPKGVDYWAINPIFAVRLAEVQEIKVWAVQMAECWFSLKAEGKAGLTCSLARLCIHLSVCPSVCRKPRAGGRGADPTAAAAFPPPEACPLRVYLPGNRVPRETRNIYRDLLLR